MTILLRTFLFSSVLKGNPDYCSGFKLLFMHAVRFHCPSCPTNCRMRIGYRLLETLCGNTTFSSLFMSESWPKLIYWLRLELFCFIRPVLLSVFTISVCRDTTMLFLNSQWPADWRSVVLDQSINFLRQVTQSRVWECFVPQCVYFLCVFVHLCLTIC